MITHHSSFHRRALSVNRRAALRIPAFLALAFFGVSGCGGAGKGPVAGKDPIKKVVEVENNIQMLMAWTENGAKASVLVRIDPADDMTLFQSAIREDMKNAAAHLKRRNEKVLEQIAPLLERGGVVNLGSMAGMYKRVIWVVPSLKAVGETPVDAYKSYFVAQRKFPAAAVADFKAEGKYITGTFAGMPLTITRLADLSLAADENAIIDIDISYFPAVKLEDKSYRTGMSSLLSFLRELGSRNVKTRLVTVNLSSQTNAVPMDLRYFGDVIREALTRPENITGPVPTKWKLMIEAEDSLLAKRYAASEALYKEITKNVKDDPGVYFSLAIAQGYQDKGEECRASLLDAYRLDNEYLKGFFQLARVLGVADKIEAGLAILDTPDLANILAPAELDYQRGLFFYNAHRPFDAATYLTSVARERPKEFGLFTILFRAHREAGNTEGQIFSLQKLVTIDDGRVRREMPWVYADLGQLYEQAGYFGNASEMYEKYMKVRPADSLSPVFQKKIKSWKGKNLLRAKP